MGLFRKKTVERTDGNSDSPIDLSAVLKAVVTRSDTVANEIRTFSAAELQPFVTRAARTFGPDARQYLIVGDSVG